MSGYTQITQEERHQIYVFKKVGHSQSKIATLLGRRHSKAQPRIGEQVETLIREEWSPEQIAGRIAMEHGVSISHKWIYQYIYAD